MLLLLRDVSNTSLERPELLRAMVCRAVRWSPTRTTACVSDQRRGSVVSSTPPQPGTCTVALSLMLLAMLLLLHVLLLELRQTSAPIRSAPVLRDAGRTMSSSPEQSLLASLRCRLPSPSYQPTLRMEMIGGSSFKFCRQKPTFFYLL